MKKVTSKRNNIKRLTPRQRQIIFRRISIPCSIVVFAVILAVLVSGCFSKAKAADNYNKYFKCITVSYGETIYDYAEEYADFHYNSKEDYIKEVANINKINPDKITSGKSIIIPYYSEEIK